ncbi:MAG: hypothetical protein N2645_11695 [Clostridia bacterium]|nr:hypothetical protein [Clostridia bacterium]
MENIITILTPFISTGVTWIFTKISSKIPKWLLPTISGLVGGAIVSITQLTTTLQTPKWYIGILLGLAGVGLHELKQKIEEAMSGNGKTD